MKKFFSLILVFVLCLSISLPAFAMSDSADDLDYSPVV